MKRQRIINLKKKEVVIIKKIKKAIIPAAGLGTRFLPATKAIPKEMIPIVDKPTIQYIIEEIVESDIEDIIIVTRRSKSAIEDHFDNNEELELNLKNKNKQSLLKTVGDISNFIDIQYVRQKEPLGLGHAIWSARKFIGNEPFAVLLGDMIIDSKPPALKQLIDVYDKVQSSIIAVEPVDWADVSKYGVINGELVGNRLYEVNKLVEKPKSTPPSNIAVIGRYILEPEIFAILEQIPPGAGGEIQLTDALQNLLLHQKLFAFQCEGKVYDVGDKFGFLKATVEFGCKDENFKKYLKQLEKESGGFN